MTHHPLSVIISTFQNLLYLGFKSIMYADKKIGESIKEKYSNGLQKYALENKLLCPKFISTHALKQNIKERRNIPCLRCNPSVKIIMSNNMTTLPHIPVSDMINSTKFLAEIY